MNRKNFTLVELLVVIAIIAILAGMVMPALGHARATGVRTQCTNDKKQLITAMLMYAQSNDNYMIYRSGASTPYSDVLTGRFNSASSSSIISSSPAGTATVSLAGSLQTPLSALYSLTSGTNTGRPSRS